jgi:hypothetical protein
MRMPGCLGQAFATDKFRCRRLPKYPRGHNRFFPVRALRENPRRRQVNLRAEFEWVSGESRTNVLDRVEYRDDIDFVAIRHGTKVPRPASTSRPGMQCHSTKKKERPA